MHITGCACPKMLVSFRIGDCGLTGIILWTVPTGRYRLVITAGVASIHSAGEEQGAQRSWPAARAAYEAARQVDERNLGFPPAQDLPGQH